MLVFVYIFETESFIGTVFFKSDVEEKTMELVYNANSKVLHLRTIFFSRKKYRICPAISSPGIHYLGPTL
jgi:hypothetical protein